MRALIWKEVRELLPAFILILCSAITLGIADVWYNWDKDRFVGISLGFCWLISMAAALLSGANVMARETHGQLSFLSSWPISRARIWAVKVAVTVVMLALLLVLIYGICTGLLVMRGYDAWHIYTEMIAMPQYIQIATLVGLFCFTLMLSTLLRSPMAAAGLGFLFGGSVVLLYLYLIYDYLPDRWGPWLGFHPASIAVTTRGVIFASIGLLAAVCAAWGFVRTPIVESRRRAAAVFGSYLGILACGFLLTIAAMWHIGKPCLESTEELRVEPVSLEPTGHWLTIGVRHHPYPFRARVDSLLVIDVDSGRCRRVVRGPILDFGCSPAGDRLFFTWGVRARWPEEEKLRHWVLELASGRMRRLLEVELGGVRHPSWGEMALAASPQGTYVPTGMRTFLRTTDTRMSTITMPKDLASDAVLRWAADERTVYCLRRIYTRQEPPELSQTLLLATEMSDLTTRTIAVLPDGYMGWDVSPDMRWLVALERGPIPERWDPKSPSQPLEIGRMVLMELENQQMHYFDDLQPVYDSWLPDGRHLWCRTVMGSPRRRDYVLKLLDLEQMSIVRTISRDNLDGQIPSYTRISPRGDRMYVMSFDVDEHAKRKDRHVWTAKPDGADLRTVGKVDREILGWTHDGGLVIWGRGTDQAIMRLDLDSGEKRVIFAPERR